MDNFWMRSLRVHQEISSSLLSTAIALGLCLPLRAEPQTALEALPARPDAALVLDLNAEIWKYLAGRKILPDPEADSLVKGFLGWFKQQGMALESQLLPRLGSHLALASYSQGRWQAAPALVLSLALKSPQAGQAFQNWLKENAQPLQLQSSTLYRFDSHRLPETLQDQLRLNQEREFYRRHRKTSAFRPEI